MKKISLLFITIFSLSVSRVSIVNAQGGVGINPGGSPPDNSAALDINFNNKGLLIPRMTTVQRDAIVNPAEGLQIYNTDCKVFNYNAGTSSSPSWATLNSSNALIAGVSISATPVGAICSGASVTFIATPASGINSPTYQWKVNGNNTGTNSTTYTTTGLNNGDVVTCILSSTAPCVSGSPATSNALTMLVNAFTPASVTIAASPSNTVCAGTSVTFSATPVNGGSSPFYQWQINGLNVGTNSATYTTSTLNTNDEVSCVMTSNATCVTNSPAASNTVTITVNPIPASSFTPVSGIVNGATTFTPTTGGATYSWTFTGGSLTNSISQNPSVTWTSTGTDTVSLQVTLNGCSSSTTIPFTIANPPSCLAILNGNPSSASGVYSIIPPGGGGAISVYCDMVTDGGGWTLVGKSDYQSTANSNSNAVNSWPLSSYSIADDGTGTGKFSDALIDNIASSKQVRLFAPATSDYIELSYSGSYTYTWSGMGVSGVTSSYFTTWNGSVSQDGSYGWFLFGAPNDGKVVGMNAGGNYCGGSSTTHGPGTQTNINTCNGTNQTWYRYLWFVR